MDAPAKTAAPPRRPRLRFTLRLLLVGLTLLCLGLGWWTHRAREQRRIVERIRAGNGEATHHHIFRLPRGVRLSLGEDYFFHVRWVRTSDRSILRELLNLKRLQGIELDNSSISDEDVKPFRELNELFMLCIDSEEGHHVATNVGDATLGWAGAMPNLKYIRIDARRVTSEGLRALAESPSLQIIELYCAECSIDGDAIAELRRLPHLTALRIWLRSGSDWEELAEWDPGNVMTTH